MKNFFLSSCQPLQLKIDSLLTPLMSTMSEEKVSQSGCRSRYYRNYRKQKKGSHYTFIYRYIFALPALMVMCTIHFPPHAITGFKSSRLHLTRTTSVSEWFRSSNFIRVRLFLQLCPSSLKSKSKEITIGTVWMLRLPCAPKTQ